MVKIELVYVASNNVTVHLNLDLPIGSTLSDALSLSKIYDSYPETIFYPVGIFSKIMPRDTVLRNGDRVELYRPLTLDPKEKRRQLASKKK